MHLSPLLFFFSFCSRKKALSLYLIRESASSEILKEILHRFQQTNSQRKVFHFILSFYGFFLRKNSWNFYNFTKKVFFLCQLLKIFLFCQHICSILTCVVPNERITYSTNCSKKQNQKDFQKINEDEIGRIKKGSGGENLCLNCISFGI